MCSEASRSGLGSLTKMSPLHVMDQIACGEGRPWTLRLSQQDRLSRASWRGERAGQCWEGAGGRPRPGGGPRTEPGPSVMCAHPVIHVLLGGSGQMHRPPLPRPLGRVEGEGVLGLIEHRDQHRHLVEEHVDVLLMEGGGQGCHRGRGGPGGLGAQGYSGWSPCRGGGTGMAWGPPGSREPVLGVPGACGFEGWALGPRGLSREA